MNIDLIIKIFHYLKKNCKDTESKKWFLSLRLLRKKIAEVFHPIKRYITNKNINEPVPNYIKTLKWNNDMNLYDISKLADKCKNVNYIIIKKIINSNMVILNYSLNYSHITSYKGPYNRIFNHMPNLKKVKITHLDDIINFNDNIENLKFDLVDNFPNLECDFSGFTNLKKFSLKIKNVFTKLLILPDTIEKTKFYGKTFNVIYI